MRFYELTHRLRRLLFVIWPDTCPICGDNLPATESPVCLNCLAKMPLAGAARELVYIGAPDNKVKIVSWFTYNVHDESHRLIHHIKYHDRPTLARKLGRELAEHKGEELGQVEILLPIPLHWKKYIKRSYNQTLEIARGIADITGARISNNLYARRDHASQTHYNNLERAHNVSGIFAVKRAEELNGRHIAIVDDVITTGATMYSALRPILDACTPASVTFLSLAATNRTR